MGVLPATIEGRGIVLRSWEAADAEVQAEAVAESDAHLRPWMSFMSGPALSIDERRTMLAGWERDRLDGGDALYGIFVDDAVAGSCGLHRRLGPGALEIGYWLHPSFEGRGIATGAVRLLIETAFSTPGIDRVEIHHDKANVRSAAIPRRLGFVFAGEEPDEPDAPAEVGIEWRWQLVRGQTSDVRRQG